MTTSEVVTSHTAFLRLLLESHAILLEIGTGRVQVLHKKSHMPKPPQLPFVLIVAVMVSGHQSGIKITIREQKKNFGLLCVHNKCMYVCMYAAYYTVWVVCMYVCSVLYCMGCMYVCMYSMYVCSVLYCMGCMYVCMYVCMNSEVSVNGDLYVCVSLNC
jgi:hypothetical protein